MRIARTEKLQRVYENSSVKRQESKVGVSYGKDSVVFSSFAKELQLATKAIKEAPEVRVEKVEQFKTEIESGKYHRSSAQIAEKILGF